MAIAHPLRSGVSYRKIMRNLWWAAGYNIVTGQRAIAAPGPSLSLVRISILDVSVR